MAGNEFNLVQHKKESGLVEERLIQERPEHGPTEVEKNWFNFQYMRYGIMHGSLYFKCAAALLHLAGQSKDWKQKGGGNFETEWFRIC